MEYEILGRDDDGDGAGDDGDGSADDTDKGPPEPSRRAVGRRATLKVAALAATGLAAAAWLIGWSGDLSGGRSGGLSGESPPPGNALSTPSLTLFDSLGPGEPVDDLGIGQVCKPELVTGDTRSEDRLTVSFALINGRDIPLQLTSVTPQLSRSGLLKPYQVRTGGRCGDVGGEDVARRLPSGAGVLVTVRFRLLDRCPNGVAVRVVVRAAFIDGSPAAQHPIPQTVHLAARLPVLDSLSGKLFPDC